MDSRPHRRRLLLLPHHYVVVPTLQHLLLQDHSRL
ncbi:hypothetical protein ACHAWC_001077 [Mediolabrus comicus]